jgi:hypothetical protein
MRASRALPATMQRQMREIKARAAKTEDRATSLSRRNIRQFDLADYCTARVPRRVLKRKKVTFFEMISFIYCSFF